MRFIRVLSANPFESRPLVLDAVVLAQSSRACYRVLRCETGARLRRQDATLYYPSTPEGRRFRAGCGLAERIPVDASGEFGIGWQATRGLSAVARSAQADTFQPKAQ